MTEMSKIKLNNQTSDFKIKKQFLTYQGIFKTGICKFLTDTMEITRFKGRIQIDFPYLHIKVSSKDLDVFWSKLVAELYTGKKKHEQKERQFEQ